MLSDGVKPIHLPSDHFRYHGIRKFAWLISYIPIESKDRASQMCVCMSTLVLSRMLSWAGFVYLSTDRDQHAWEAESLVEEIKWVGWR